MIISHKHRYLFIEIPLTASWAIRHELCEYYDGEPVLRKHASFPEFARYASDTEKQYFVFATVRNPLDTAVSQFFKLKTNHKGVYTDPEALQAGQVEQADLEKFSFIQDNDAGFEEYFRRYHRRPFASMIDLSADRLDFVIRYEGLQAGFDTVLGHLDITPVRPVPVMNKTQDRRSDWQAYYSPAIIDQAKHKFGPFMRRWDYEFPLEWGASGVKLTDELSYRMLAQARKFYLTRFRYNPTVVGKLVRNLRSALMR